MATRKELIEAVRSRYREKADALERYPGAEREPNSREERYNPGGAAAIVTKGR